MNMYNFTERDLEDNADNIKIVILKNLVDDGFLNYDVADKWCSDHTIIVTEKTMFRTLSNLWKNIKDTSGFYYMVVKK